MPRKRKDAGPQLDKDPLWYKNGVIYQGHVRAFCDSDGNGIGDFRGLTSKLDYLQDLGVTAVWLLPFYPSPLKDDGYDIADYTDINPIYGDLSDFREFLKEAHGRGLRVITELVINHTSDQHPWFQRARTAHKGSKWRDFYVWSDTPDRYKDARIIFKDFEVSNWTWDPVANSHYWHRFYAHQPDLNFENPAVHAELMRILDFWMEMGVDGLRLDAVPYLYEREGTNCENLPETHAFLKKLRRHIDEHFGDRMLLAEANQWPEDAVTYFGEARGDECHMAFHFPLMPRLFMSLRMEDRVPIVDILEQTPPIPETSQWALFLRNHDELTLEMVTDEERDYMYRVYAKDPRARINLGIRRRLAPLLGNDRKRIELLNGLLLSLPGTPVIYYGDEIGMGENTFLGDRNGVRTPMQWSSDRNAGFSRANPQALYLPIIVDPEYHYETVNVEAQSSNPHSLLWWMRRILALRRQWKAMGRGTLEFLHPENRKVLVYIRRYENENLLVVANLSRFVQPVELDLSAFKQFVPVEVFGRTRFPAITDRPYFLTLGPHAFFWFSLEPAEQPQVIVAGQPAGVDNLPLITVASSWEDIFNDDAVGARLSEVLRGYVRERRWFGGKAKDVKAVEIVERLPVPVQDAEVHWTLIRIDYLQGDPETYALPLGLSTREEAEALARNSPALPIARIQVRGTETQSVLFDAVGSKEFCRTLLQAMSRRRRFRGQAGELLATSTPALKAIQEAPDNLFEPSPGRNDQSNTAVLFGDRLILKLFRRAEPGINPDLEIGRFLTARKFPFVPPVAGALEYRSHQGDVTVLGIMHGFIANGKDGWEHSLDVLSRYYERIQAMPAESAKVPTWPASLVAAAGAELPAEVRETVGIFMSEAEALGKCTAAMHLTLASDIKGKDFAPEPFTPHYQRGLYQSMRNLAIQNFQLLQKRVKQVPEPMQAEAQRLISLQSELLKRYKAVYEKRVNAMRIRCHGDYHLGQVLHTGKDFMILDFEGEPARSLSERRLKRSPLRDVAGMLRSFHYAAYAGLLKQVERGLLPADQINKLEPWARYWSFWTSAAFLRTYLEDVRPAGLLPKEDAGLETLLYANLLDKAVYELGYELNNRPDWVRIPLQGMLQLLETPA